MPEAILVLGYFFVALCVLGYCIEMEVPEILPLVFGLLWPIVLPAIIGIYIARRMKRLS